MAYEPSEDELHTRKLIINSCSALGGLEDRETDHGTTERIYCVGDEALACLKDLKRIIRADEIFTRKVLIELNVIETDLIPIILLHSSLSSPISERFILASIEIIVPLTWPIQHNPEGLDPELEQNILQYYQKIKMQLLEKGIFEAALRVLLKSLRIPYRERSSRDQSIIRLILYFWRNLTAISDPKVTSMASEEQILLSTLQALLLVRLHESNVLELLLTMASTMDTSEAGEYNVILLEILFYLLEHANAREIFMTKKITPVTSNANKYKNTSSKLSTMLHSENNNKRLKTLHTPSRHNRFGGSYILEGWDGGKRVSHKQHAGYADLDQLIGIRDKNRRGQKRKQMDEVGTHDAYSSQSSRLCLKQFAKSFLETCFNSFYSILYKDMQREDKKIIERDHARFYYTKKWFLEYISYEILETMSIEEKKKKQQENINNNNNKQTALPSSSNLSSITNDQLILPGSTQDNHHLMEQSTTSQEKEDVNNNNCNKNNGQDENVNLNENKQPSNFHLVANAMELSMFWTCMRRIRICLEDKIWYDAQITADCLRQMLVLLNIMNRSSEQEYREVADYIQSNIYHEQETLDIFPDLIKAYRNQSYEYIEVTVQLIYTLLKMLESYCKNQTVLFIRKKKNGKKPKKVTGEENDLDGGNNNEDDDDDNANSEEDERDRRIAYKEHVFAFENFEKKFATYDTIRVCCILLEQYKTLKPETLRSITGLFHRIMVKRKIEHLFWKLPTLDLFNRILIDYHFVPRSSAFDELHQFIVYVVRQFFKKAEEYPLLFIETIFKIEPCRINTND